MSKQTIIEPLGDRILLKEITDEVREEKTKSGIIIPVTVTSDKGGSAKRGTAVAVGPGKITEDGKRIPVSVKKDDVVLFQWGDEVMMNGEKYFLVHEDSVLAVIK